MRKEDTREAYRKREAKCVERSEFLCVFLRVELDLKLGQI